MTTISIRERGALHPGTVVSIDGQEYPIMVTDPFSAKQEEQLEWYFEAHLRFPFTDQVKAQAAAASVTTYGEQLFRQVFADPDAYAEYRAATQENLSDLTVEIAGLPAFQRLHWEALKDPKLAQPLALQTAFVRRNLTPQPIKARLREAPTINVLLVTARPGGARDVGYRTIARPLVGTLRKAQLRVRVDILRPGTYEALVRHLEVVQERHGPGYYHVIHFDVHGGLLTYAAFDRLEQGLDPDRFTYQMRRYGRPALARYDGVKAFLFMEHAQPGHADPVEATELANLLQMHGIPIVVLNACQSGKQVGDQETSLGSQLLVAGVQMVLAMGYSVTVSAAERLMAEFYAQLFGGASLGAALRSARMELHNRKGRRAYFNQSIDLEDWLLPVVYENRPQVLRPRDFTAEESSAYYAAQAAGYAEPKVAYRFVGRDLDVLEIERRLLNQRNILLLRGMAGAGKTTLLHHLGWWWQTTGFVNQVFYYGYDQRAWTRQQIMDDLARRLLGEVAYVRDFQPLGLEAQQALLSERLRAARHLLVLDNLESITGAELAIQHTLPATEQVALHRFVQALAGGATLVLLGSRGGEGWLQPDTFADNVYVLPGLDPEAASELADLILARHNASQYRGDQALGQLLKLLDGYPLALEVVLPNLARQKPDEVLAALVSGGPGIEAGEIDLTQPDIQQKTRSILHCIGYSHSNLSPEAQMLLLCLAPFTGVIYTPMLQAYAAELQKQPELSGLPFDLWPQVLQEAANWGLLTEHDMPGFMRVQPTLPYFLRTRLQTQESLRSAIETAFRELYAGFSGALSQLMQSKQPQEKQLGQMLAGLEFENLSAALKLALAAHVSILKPYRALSNYLDAMRDHRRGLELGMSIMNGLEQLPVGALQGQLAIEFVSVLEDVASNQLLTKRYGAAEKSYQRTLDMLKAADTLEAPIQAILIAGVYHQLGIVAQEQRQWTQAEHSYQQSLAIFIEFNVRDEQARTYHQLGMVAQVQRQWALAEHSYQQALAIYIEFNDRYEQAKTYHQLGMLAQEQRQWAQAKQSYQQALALFIEFNDRYEQANTYHQLGMVAQEQRQWAQAEHSYQQALVIKIEFNDRYEQASTYHQLGMLAQERRQWAQAEHSYQQALAIYIEFNDRYSQAGTYHQLGTVEQAQRQWAQAEHSYQQALAIYIEFNDRYSQASTYGQLGILAKERRQWVQAREVLLTALARFVEFGDEHSMLVTLKNLAQLWRDSGDAGLPAAAAAIGNIEAAEMQAWFVQFLADEEGGGA
jgi:tetratricopeptide (TPR) repeat protein